MNEEYSASESFEALLRQTSLVRDHKTTQSRYKTARYEFAINIINGNEPSKEDLFVYLTTWAQYMAAIDKLGSSNPIEYDRLKYDCDQQLVSPLVEKHLRNRIKILERRSVFAQALDTALSQRSFFGLQANDNNELLETENELLEIATEHNWIHLEVAGLKLCLRFFDRE